MLRTADRPVARILRSGRVLASIQAVDRIEPESDREPITFRWPARQVVKIDIVKGIDGARHAEGAVVVIDVLRAFTTAAYAFDAGITEIQLVSIADEAFGV